MAAITQITRMQHRAGLYRELPLALNEAEFGWSLDTRQLFIGNGPIHPGNTEIITQNTPASSFSYSYKSPAAYQQLAAKGADIGVNYFTASTGYVEDADNTETMPSTFNATIRSFQQKFDEIVSVKDYKAIGDGYNDDTGALVRAAKDLFSEEFGAVGSGADAVKRNVALYLPGGVYRIRQNLVAYPNMTLIGDPGKTIILLDVELATDDNDDAVLITGDSYGQFDFDMGSDFGDTNATPSILNNDGFYAYGIAFHSNQPSDTAQVKKRQVVRLSRATNTIFERCSFNFVGSRVWQTGDSVIDAPSAVLISAFNDSNSLVNNHQFIQCSSSGVAHDFNIIDAASNVTIDHHDFNGNLLSLKIGSDGSYDSDVNYRHAASINPISNITVTNSTFSNYTAYAIDVFGTATMVSSLKNRFNGAGKSIRFGASTSFCNSINDYFPGNTALATCGVDNPRIDNLTTSATIMNAQDFVIFPIGFKNLNICGNLTINGSVISNPDSTTSLLLTTVAYPSATATQPTSFKGNSVVINYSMRIPNGGTNIIRTGTIKIAYFETTPNVVSSANISFSDDFVEVGGVGTGLTISVVPNNANQNIEISATSSIGTPTTKVVASALVI